MKNYLLAIPAIAGLLLGASSVSAEGLQGSYVGVGPAIGLQGQGVGGSGLARVQFGDIPASARLQGTLTDSFEGSVSLSGDIPVGEATNIYLGGGAAFRDAGATGGILTAEDASVGFAQVGVESEIAERTVLFLDVKVGFPSDATTVVPTVGLGYRF
ncbi:hypothetical protein SCBWM1_gp38 [Synechococcus phage S-CBWM1]|uniref:Outer membrane protein beta-barrel domain-containing protein n=1 Tax=Synechococcus phage S-CBWM1 TaxID=2053653 RepID=A0A3G1L3F6_9CAUD|nr:hypothetical protein HOU61_gp159 [Synechococcus phage S-CBWM1]ATW62722.1 hypothetical protein SCBWM1_gp38 [Synechococcus phage S-CBWM1]